MANPTDEFRLVSPTIHHLGRVPRKYTGDGQGAKKDLSPPVEWYNLPEGIKSLALVVQDIDANDPDGPIVPWAHWVVVNIPPTLRGLPEGFSGKEEEVGGDYGGIKKGHNDWKVSGYRGPKMPTFGHHPPGHRLEFKLYALDEDLHHGNKEKYTYMDGINGGVVLVTKEKLLDAIEGHVHGEAVLLAYF